MTVKLNLVIAGDASLVEYQIEDMNFQLDIEESEELMESLEYMLKETYPKWRDLGEAR